MARHRWWYDPSWPPPSRPREVKGGVRAHSTRGRFGQSWWGRRWVEVLEGFHVGARLQRGRSYARRGQVLAIELAHGCVTARVQGSRAYPYDVSIRVRAIPSAARRKLRQAMGRRPALAAGLLAGEMPEELEDLFLEAGVSLFPERRGDLRTSCSCPDWSDPCKHVAAVYYLVAEELDREPLLLLRLRGLEREDLLGADPRAGGRRRRGRTGDTGTAGGAPESVPLPADPSDFWKDGPSGSAHARPAEPPPLTAALPRRLGPFPFWRGEQPFLECMERLYRPLRSIRLPAEEEAG